MTEVRLITYGHRSEVANMDRHTILKIAEESRIDCEAKFSTFEVSRRVEYRIGHITIEVDGGRGFSCFQSQLVETTLRCLLELQKNTDKLVILVCYGYCKGEPLLEYSKSSGKLGVLVRGIEPIGVLCTRDDIVSNRYTYDQLWNMIQEILEKGGT